MVKAILPINDANYKIILDSVDIEAQHRATNCLQLAIKSIDEIYGEGYAKKNPNLVMSFCDAHRQVFLALLSQITTQS